MVNALITSARPNTSAIAAHQRNAVALAKHSEIRAANPNKINVYIVR